MTRRSSVALGSPVTPPGPDLGAGTGVAGSPEEARRQTEAVAASRHADDDQAFIDALSLDEE